MGKQWNNKKTYLALKTLKCAIIFWISTKLQNAMNTLWKESFRSTYHWTMTLQSKPWKKVDCACYTLKFYIIFILRILFILLHRMNIKTSFLCDHCRVPDYIEHFFYWLWFSSWFLVMYKNTNKSSDKKKLISITLLGSD